MDEDEIADLIAACYGAAAGAVPWSSVKAATCGVFRAPFAGLVTGDADVHGRLVNVFENEAPLPAWRMRNPFLEASRRLWAGRSGERPVVALGPEILDDHEYVRSEYYADYGRRLEMRHEVGTMVDADRNGMTCFGLYRPERAGAFDDRDRALLQTLRPHLRRALQLRETLRPAMTRALAGMAALDALPRAAILVDRELRILHANAAAERMAAQRHGLIFTARTRVAGVAGETTLSLADRKANGALKRLVEAVALLGRPGSAIRIPLSPPAASDYLIAAVLPLPAALLPSHPAAGIAAGTALLLIRDGLAHPAPPPPLLRELFGLTPAEVEVAAMLGSGARPLAIASSRGVTIDTVRLQLRSVMHKTGADNLRDLDRILASVADIAATAPA